MVLETPIIPFLKWLLPHLAIFLGLAVGLGVGGFFIGFLIAAVRNGPGPAWATACRVAATGWDDLRNSSIRRMLAIAQLAFQESIRNYVLIVFGLFVVILLFAGWYLDPGSDNPERLYLSFVLKATNFLTVLLAILLSTFSLPNDIKNRTIYTVVTKPVRSWEIVLGRITGFMGVATLLLGLMCLFSYVFVIRGMNHRHSIEPTSLRAVEGSSDRQGETTLNHGHRHSFRIHDDGRGYAESEKGHTHRVVAAKSQGDEEIQIGSPQGALAARVPVYGSLQFLGRDGKPADKGINIGKEWTYRGYVEGGTLGAGVYRFDGVDPRAFPQGLPIEMSIRVFRTYKGEIERGIIGTLTLKNPSSGLQSEPITFTASDNVQEQRTIPRRIKAAPEGGRFKEVDLFDDLTDNGQLEVWIRCAEKAQYYGMSKTDLYLRAKDGLFGFNFLKTYFTVWLQLLVVTSFGVMFSTILTGPVAMLATFASMVMGYFSQTILDVSTGKLEGGGPTESLVRIFKQQNLTTPLEGSVGPVILQALDQVMMALMTAVSFLMPNFRDFAEYGGMNTTRFVAYGFDIPLNLVAQHTLMALAFVLVATVAGYFLLKTKEIAA